MAKTEKLTADKLEAPPPSKPKPAPHANAYPREGFSLLVDGRFKSHYETEAEAQKAGMTLKGKFPLLQVAVRDAVTAERNFVELPDPPAA